MSEALLSRLGLGDVNSGVFADCWITNPTGECFPSLNPATGKPIAFVRSGGVSDYELCADAAVRAFLQWRLVPAPRRGELVRRLGEAFRRHQDDLGELVTLEVGKIRVEGRGEVQEIIDMADFAVGLSRQIYGLTMASERPRHRMFEQWHPLGPVGIITAFNFPVAVWAWNALLAVVCGDSCVWKPSPLAPLTAIAVQKIAAQVLEEEGAPSLFSLCVGDASVGAAMASDRRAPLISATGSCAMGRNVAAAVGARLGRSLLELGGNNAAILTEDADLDLALRAVLFAAVGTAGQRCTTLRRLIVHERVADAFVERLARAYASIPIGDPADDKVLMGPLIRPAAVAAMLAAIQTAKQQGGEIVGGGNSLDRPGYFVEPTIVRISRDAPIVRHETFAPLLWVSTYRNLDDAIAANNGVDQGLSSAIFSNGFRSVERFLAADGSDCGIANVNSGTSGAEIGGAFGGEKDTGGGRESGSDAWKAYMRRQTCTLNFGDDLPLAQGIEFDVSG